jgi:hypothetical protein
MLSDKYLWLVPELTLVHEVYKLALFQELVTPTLAAAEASQDVPSVATDMVATSLASEEVQDSKVAILRGM